MSEGLAKARAEIAQVCQLLLCPSPDVLDQCTPLLQAAISEMNSHRLELGGRPPERRALEQALQLRESVGRAGVLLEGAARFHRNWIRRRDALLGGYAPDGQAAAANARGCLAVEG
jgi:hypothetical protein